jgi:hypothetical protein
LKGVPLLVAFGVLAGFALHTAFGLSLARVALPITVLVAIQAAFFISMYGVRKRYKQSGDLRAGLIVTGMYCLLIGLVGMYYVRELGIVSVKTVDDLGFSIYVVIVIGSGVAALSVKKLTRSR